jgi:hypothetical protein
MSEVQVKRERVEPSPDSITPGHIISHHHSHLHHHHPPPTSPTHYQQHFNSSSTHPPPSPLPSVSAAFVHDSSPPYKRPKTTPINGNAAVSAPHGPQPTTYASYGHVTASSRPAFDHPPPSRPTTASTQPEQHRSWNQPPSTSGPQSPQYSRPPAMDNSMHSMPLPSPTLPPYAVQPHSALHSPVDGSYQGYPNPPYPGGGNFNVQAAPYPYQKQARKAARATQVSFYPPRKSACSNPITKACNQCRQRKQKCDEQRPCSYCRQENVKCEYKEVQPAKYVFL